MQLIVLRNNKGLSLVEVLIALVITLVVSLGLMQTALLSIDTNTTNLLRDEAISIAEERMRELRDRSFGSLIAGTVTETKNERPSLEREFRKFTRDYTIIYKVKDLDANAKQIEVEVKWKNQKDDDFSHTITTMKRR